MEEKVFVKNIYEDVIKEGRARKSLAQDLSDTIAESLSGAKYVNELLQNADDSGSHQTTPINVEFIITEDYLIFKHNGKHFDEKDVDAISDIASKKREKISDLEAIGHKGRGFKAVFSIADYVLIVSNKWQFRFDKHHELWKDFSEEYPWPVIPVWTEKNEYPLEVAKYIDSQSVCFIFKIKEKGLRAQIIEQVNNYINKPAHLLFLKHTKSLSISDTVSKHKNSVNLKEKLLEEKEAFKIKRISAKTLEKTYQWYVCRVECSIDAGIAQQLSKSENIPAKYKTLKSIPIMIAIEYDNSGLRTALFPQVFCYLSTEVALNLPFLINAEFFLEPARAHFQDREIAKVWNSYLLEEIFFYQFHLLEHIAIHQSQWRDVVNFVCNPAELQLGGLQKYSLAMSEKFNKGLNEKQFVIDMSSKSADSVKNLTIDTTGFTEQFGVKDLKSTTVHSEVKNKEKLGKLGAKTFTIENILNEIEKTEFLDTLKDPAVCKKFIIFLYNIYIQHKDDSKTSKKIIDRLKNVPFILSSGNQLCKPSEIFIPNDSLKYCMQGFDYIHLLHAFINTLEDEVKNWLNNLGLKEINLAIVVKQVNSHPEDLLKFTNKLYERHQQKKLEEGDYSAFTQLNLMMGGNAAPLSACQCYFSSQYKPKQNLQKRLQGYQYVSPKYGDPNNFKEWKNFLLKIGVSETLNADNISAIIEVANTNKENLLNFTRLVFSLFSKLDQATKKHLKNLHLLTTNGEIKPNTNFYISDFYKPRMPIQDKIKALFYISEEYVQESDNVEKWREFFASLGIRQSLEIKKIEQQNVLELEKDLPWARKYFTYLSNLAFEENPVCGRELAPSRTMGYRSQHTMSYFADIEYLDAILDTPLFWVLIKNSYLSIQISTNEVIYRTAMSARKVPSCIAFYINQACINHYGRCASEMYSPKLKDLLGEDGRIADIASELSKEQLEFFGFKQILSLEDCIRLLVSFSESLCTQEAFNKINTIYQHLYQITESDPAASVSQSLQESTELKLLAQSGQFVSVSKLFYLSTDLALPANANAIKKPESMANNNFETVCQILGITCIRESELDINPSNQESTNEIHGNTLNKLHLIALIESYKNDILLSEIEIFIEKFMMKCISKLQQLKVYWVEEVALSYKDLYCQSSKYWFDKKSNTLYFTKKLNMFDLKIISEILVGYLELKIRSDDFWLLLSSSEQDIQSNFMACNLTEANIQKALLVKEAAKAKAMEIEREAEREKEQNSDEAMDLEGQEVKQDNEKPSYDGSSSEEEGRRGQKREHSEIDTPQKNTASSFGGSFTFWGQSSSQGKAAATPSPEEPPAKKARLIKDKNQLKLTDLSFTALPPQDRVKIGYEGERLIYKHLEKKYAEKHGAANIAETEEGFLIQKDLYKKEIKWLNKKNDPNNPDGLSRALYDIEITTESTVGEAKQSKRNFVEVKGTLATDKIEANFSSEEWSFGEHCKSQFNTKYTLFCITGIGKETQNIKKIKDLNNPEIKKYDVKKVLIEM
jgi:hypothetical protein